MRSATLKWIVFLSTLLVAVIVFVQLYWLNKIYSLEQKQFDTNIVKCVRGLFEDLDLANYPAVQLENLIEHPDPNTFLIKIDTIPKKDSLIFFLKSELEDFDVLSDCKLGVYDVRQNDYLFEAYLPAAASRHITLQEPSLPINKRAFSYVCLYFPNRDKYVLAKLSFWIGGAILLLAALVGFSASLFYLYKQKTLNEVQKDFVNNFTHEFKTPLAVIKLAMEVLTNSSLIQQQDRLKKYSNIVNEQTEHLQLQVERLLKAASSNHQHLHLKKETFRVNDVINDVLHQVDPMIREKTAKVDLDLEENNLPITADRSHIAMALVNLLENAIKYSHDPHVIIKTDVLEDDYCISVKDNGIGIEKKYVKFLFKKFFRVPTGNVHNVKGFGLGLNFVKKVVDTHRGKIIVNSLPGIGTEFKILLPK